MSGSNKQQHQQQRQQRQQQTAATNSNNNSNRKLQADQGGRCLGTNRYHFGGPPVESP